MTLPQRLLLVLAGIALASPMAAAAAPRLSVVARIAGPTGGWDYASFDAARRRVYVAHGNAVMVIDADSGRVTPSFAPGAHLHAVIPVPASDRLVTTNGGDSTARIINAADGSLIATVATAPDPDGAVFDSFTGDVAVVSGDPGLVSLVDPRTAKVAAVIPVASGLEFPASDGKGRLYVNIEETGEIAVIDVARRKLVARYSMPGCVKPTGLALTADGRLISACASGVAKILRADSGKEVASLTIGRRPDAVLLDEARGVAYIPSGMSGTLAVIALSGPANNSIIATVPTQPGARTGAVDLQTGRIYLPTARYGPAINGERPEPLPGTFEVLVVGDSR